jgi:hypothetical protein
MRLVVRGLMAGAMLTALTLSISLHAQEFKVGSKTVQVHGFASQGYAYTNQNNFLTMNTSHGSPAFTDGSVNLSMQVTNKFRVGGQGYARKIGSLDDFRPSLDWAYGDYKFAKWFGVRAGKVKTAMGLYNDTQDMEFLHTWALLPQGVYPTDLRTTFIAHTGGDVYGQIKLKKAGKLDYTAYGGLRSFDEPRGLLLLATAARAQYPVDQWPHGGLGSEVDDTGEGLDARHFVGETTMHPSGVWVSGPLTGAHYTIDSQPDRVWVGYGDYNRGKWEFSSEYRSTLDNLVSSSPPCLARRSIVANQSSEGWFAPRPIA